MFALVLVAIFILRRTQFGRHTYAIGGNKEAAIRAGIPVDRHTIMLYMFSAGTAGVAGFLYNARFMGGAADAGDAQLMMSIAAVVIGGVSLFGGAGRVTGTIVGALILAVLETGLIMIDVQTFWKYVVVGIVVILAVLMDQTRDLIVGRAETE
jgi:ribose transport system permease protein